VGSSCRICKRERQPTCRSHKRVIPSTEPIGEKKLYEFIPNFYAIMIAFRLNSTARTHHKPSLAIYLNSSINSLWNLTILPVHSVPGARKVVRKCSVPSFWPKPDPGTTHTPVASSKRKQ
jgi:hypothetical protein